ncbi:right-handed parallel beta-helix repeat-containing protein [Prolixibacteraceae bacterium Z1-6]|uniref:Right-handed parallel beta-helix repeat-containing protein n=1 Tax=Draconibacterium aestuarii TaxID=2998507 RepID=A0A9X3J5Z9_9BACT|nr:right-handed parallel beta-helix repeat-containing protein [Prolixibacteraceae bacterium Z1-6]
MKKIVLITIVTSLIVACDMVVNDEYPPQNQTEDLTVKSVVISGNDLFVFPSGDLTGVEDADNIEYALNEVKAKGGVVYLTDEDDSTVDHFYTSRNIVVNGFKGTLIGESHMNTIINAGRKSESEGFSGTISPWWSLIPIYNPYALTVLQLDNASGDVIIKDLSIKIKDNQPANPYKDYNSNEATCITNFIEILGGEHNTYIENLRLEGKESSSYGNILGMNVDYGIHVMLGNPTKEIKENGILSIKNVEIENTGQDAVLFMRFGKGSKITIDDVKTINVGRGLQAGNVFGSFVKVTKMDILIHPQGYQGIGVWTIPDGLKIMNNTIRESNYFGILFWPEVNNSAIIDNKFIDIDNNWAGILVNGFGNSFTNNDFTESGLPGWTTATPEGPGAIVLRAPTYDNVVRFPQSNDMSLCEMILDLTDDPTTKMYDGLNKIHNYQPCENLENRDNKFELLDIEPPGLFKLY